MKKRLLMPTFPLKMNLQLFAEGGEGGSSDGSNGGTSTNNKSNNHKVIANNPKVAKMSKGMAKHFLVMK